MGTNARAIGVVLSKRRTRKNKFIDVLTKLCFNTGNRTPHTSDSSVQSGDVFFRGVSMKYNRCATTVERQVEILKERGLQVKDTDFAVKAIREIGYFRFKGYCLPYYQSKDKFKNDVSFELIYENYRFDERFRLLLFQIIEHVEVELKSVISGDFALETSALGFYNHENFENKEYHELWLDNFKKLISQSAKRRELYTEHYLTKYEKTFPVWVATEISDFGSLSKFFSNIKTPLRNKISKSNYGVASVYLTNWIHLLSVVRNICAHNGRIYDRILPIQAKLTSKERKNNIANNRVFVAILICKKLCLNEDYFSMFAKNLQHLIQLYDKSISIDRIGFPENWKYYLC